jgi:NADH-quinone oxidoreductase subunit J
MNGLLEWIIFLALSGITVVTAAGMLLTMSMYRAGLALMASFVALAGLFILLDADLLAAIQIMMNVGGMLVMVLFMVMIMMDPGGEMMWEMKRDMHMPGLGAFSMHMPRGKPLEEQPAEHQEGSTGTSDWTCPMHPDVRQDHPGTCPKCGMTLIEDASPSHESHEHQDLPMTHNTHMEHAGDGSIHAAPVMSMEMDSSGSNGSDQDTHMSHDDMQMAAMTPSQHYHMMVDMAMSTSQLPWAIALGVASALLLVILFIKTPWPLSHVGPTQDATTMVGELLLSRYMIGFEGAAFLILAGIAGAVILARRERTPAQPSQERQGEPAATETGQGTRTHEHGGDV